MRAAIGATRCLLFAVALAALSSISAVAQAAAPLRTSFDLQVPYPPTPVAVSGKPQLVYELHITNFTRDEFALTRIEVLDLDRGRTPIGDFRDDALTALLGRPGAKPGSANPRVIAPGTRAIAYFWLPLAGDAAVPRALTHRIEFDAVHADASEHAIVEGGRFAVRDEPPVILSPPLRGGPWAAIYLPSIERGHRRMIFALDGRARIPARFAIDWIKLDENGKLAQGDDAKVANWYGYGAEVLAVADSVVAAVRDDMTEKASLTDAGPPNPLEDASGNFIALDLGRGRYAFYEHLKPRSVRVRVGDRVQAGQTIAALGFTGDSTGPHLHFHVSDAATPLVAEGLPYVFADFDVLGAYATIEAFGKGQRWTPAPAGAMRTHHREFPAAQSVIDFGAGNGDRPRAR